MGDFQDLKLLIRSHVPLLVAETHDETRALEMLTRLAIKEALPLFCWSVTDGLQRLGFGDEIEVAVVPLHHPVFSLQDRDGNARLDGIDDLSSHPQCGIRIFPGNDDQYPSVYRLDHMRTRFMNCKNAYLKS